MDSNCFGEELMREDNADSDKALEMENARTHEQDRACRSRKKWMILICFILAALGLAVLWLLGLVPERLTIFYLVVWGMLAGLAHFCFTAKWTTLFLGRIKLTRVRHRTTDTLVTDPGEQMATPIYRMILRSKTFQSVIAALIVGLLLYSGYVAKYRPDSQGTIVLGQTTLFTDSNAALRILVRDCTNSLPVAAAQVRLAIKGQGISHELGKFVTGQDGSLSEAVHVPTVPPGKYNLIIDSRSKIGKDHIVRPITVKYAHQMYLTTDKPVYQPGQTIHMRALLLNKMSLKPFAHQPILFEILDAKGNKVFKSDLISSEYGIASCDFELAHEINLGQYQILVTTGETESQKAVTVKPYVLPRFKIEVATDKAFYVTVRSRPVTSLASLSPTRKSK
jgi:hypothetical protein